MKPGYKTTEFYLTMLAMVVSLLFASGLVAAGSDFDKALAFVGAALTAMGYSVSRGLAKRSDK